MRRIEDASTPAVVPLYEAQVEALMRKQVVLEEPPPETTSVVTLGTAQEEVYRCLKNPLGLWKNGELPEQRWLLQFAFSRPIVYDWKTGFETADLSLLLSISRDFGGQKSRAVEMVRKNWNQIVQFILEAYNGLQERLGAARETN